AGIRGVLFSPACIGARHASWLKFQSRLRALRARAPPGRSSSKRNSADRLSPPASRRARRVVACPLCPSERRKSGHRGTSALRHIQTSDKQKPRHIGGGFVSW